MNAQKPGLVKDAYIYGVDSIILSLEDAVTEDQRDAARFSLYQALQNIDYGDTEVIVRISGLDTPHWQEDIRCMVVNGADGICIAKCESAQDVLTVEKHVPAAEKEFRVEEGRILLTAALESPRGILNAYEIVTTSDRMFGCAISGGDFRKSVHIQIEEGDTETLATRGQMLLAAWATGVQCLDMMFPYLNSMEGFRAEVARNRKMGFDDRSVINPKQIRFVHETFAPIPKEVVYVEKLVCFFNRQAESDMGVYTIGGKVVDTPFFEDTRRVIALTRTYDVYKGDL